MNAYSPEIKGSHNNTITIGSIYRPPNTKPKEFNTQYKELMKRLANEKNKETILGMDHNLDLLKSSNHSETQEFIDTLILITIYYHALRDQQELPNPLQP